MREKVIDQNRIKEPYAISFLNEDTCVKSRIGEISFRSGEVNTEIKIITHIEDFEALKYEWDQLAWESDTHIFQTYEWNRVWWKYFGRNKKLHIVAVLKEDKLVGVAPLFEDDVCVLGHKVYSRLQFIGSYVSQPEGEPLKGCISYSDYLDCIIQPGYEVLFYSLILKHFKEVMGNFNEIILDEVSDDSAMFITMVSLMEKREYGFSYTIKKASTSPIIELDSSLEAYLNSMSRKARSTARRYLKRSKQGKAEVFKIEKVRHADELPGVQEDFIRLHQQQWNSRGFAGTFSEQRMRDFFLEISKSFYEKNWIEFNMAVPADGDMKYVAIDVIITYKNRLYLLHRGMDEDPLYRKQGPGNVLLFARLKEAINDGVIVYDMLRGSEEFKLKMATSINQNKIINIHSGLKSERILPVLVKYYLRISKHVRTEKSHIKFVYNGKSFLKGIREYTQFLHRRIKHKFSN